MTFLRLKSEIADQQLRGYGTSDGARKGWETRRRHGWTVSKEESRRLLEQLETSGGFTYHPVHKNSPKTGYVVAVYNDYERPMPSWSVTAEKIKEYINKHRAVFNRDPDAHVGGWFDQKSKKVFLDISTVKTSRAEAEKVGRKHKQLAIWDLGRGEEIRLVAQAALRNMVRFDFPPDATPEEIANAIRKLGGMV